MFTNYVVSRAVHVSIDGFVDIKRRRPRLISSPVRSGYLLTIAHEASYPRNSDVSMRYEGRAFM